MLLVYGGLSLTVLTQQDVHGEETLHGEDSAPKSKDIPSKLPLFLSLPQLRLAV